MKNKINQNGFHELTLEEEQEFELYKIKAESIMSEMNINIEVYGSAYGSEDSTPPDVEMGMRYINRCLEYKPNDPICLNLKALLLWSGKGEHESAKIYIEKAYNLSQRDLDIQRNKELIFESPAPKFAPTSALGSALGVTGVIAGGELGSELASGMVDACFIATAAYGQKDDVSVTTLRMWRDKVLKQLPGGNTAVKAYYVISPPIANLVACSPGLKSFVRFVLGPFVWLANQNLKTIELIHPHHQKQKTRKV